MPQPPVQSLIQPPAVAPPVPQPPAGGAVVSSQHPPATTVPSSPGEGRGRRRGVFALAAALVLVVVAGAVAVREWNNSEGSGSSRSASNIAPLPASVSSLDPSGGSGFRPAGDRTWRTQTYQSADFGNLKSGVGLLLDLGARRAVRSVSFTVVGGPLAVELRAGDHRGASESGYARVAADDGASGSTTFTVKDGGTHRYWLIWVTRLADQGGGYRAVIRDPAVRAG
ncbi:MAG: hypothetical protein ACXV3A_09895 [Kineosporiaceae bacterium]